MTDQQEYIKGKENFLIRMFYYLHNGATLLNEFRNLIMGVFALYFLLKLTNPIWMVVMFVVSVPILILIGHYNVHKMAKVNEYLNTRFSTHYALKTFELNQQTVKLLEDINEKLKHGQN